MPVTETDILFLRTLARYYVLTRDQLQRLRGKEVSDRSVRKHLLKLQLADLIVKHRVPVMITGSKGAAPVYYATKDGAKCLAEYFEDDRYLKTNTREPRVDRLNHWVAVNETRMILEAAIASVPGLTLNHWIHEWEEIDKEPGDRPRFTLHTQLRENPPLSCSPDAAFLLSIQGHAKVFYLECDLGSSSPQQVAARKTKGYAELARQERHRDHFPETTLDEFGVLMVTTTQQRCLQVAHELRKYEMPEIWRLVSARDMTPERVLREPVFYGTESLEPKRLLKINVPISTVPELAVAKATGD